VIAFPVIFLELRYSLALSSFGDINFGRLMSNPLDHYMPTHPGTARDAHSVIEKISKPNKVLEVLPYPTFNATNLNVGKGKLQ
jgi:hypothetical protein